MLQYGLILLLPLLLCGKAYTQNSETETKTITFRFPAGQDAFFVPYGGNDAELNRLYALVDEYRTAIANGTIPVHVDSYCTSMPTPQENLRIASIRANRVKSELITHKGLVEGNFITKNHATAYEGRKDMVVVTLRVPEKEVGEVKVVKEVKEVKEVKVEKKGEKEAKKPDSIEKKAETEPEPVITLPPAKPRRPYLFALRTNLLYDALLLPTLGVEWRINRNIGLKVDGSRSWWGSQTGSVQKIWLVNPELRWYIGAQKRLYAGASANAGEYNIYKGIIGRLIADDTGYQGKLWNAGITIGYQLRLARCFQLDFNLGLGYTNLEYDSFTIRKETRTYKENNKSKDFFGPTQGGIHFIWTIR